MIKKLLVFIGILSFMVVVSTKAFSWGDKQLDPTDIYTNLNIPDGEFLRYGVYLKNKKYMDMCFVTKKEINTKGEDLYRIYSTYILASNSKTLTENYTNWPISCVIDPKLGSVIESGGSFYSKDDMKIFDFYGNDANGGLIYWHYKLNLEKDYVEYIFRKVNKDNKTNESIYIMNVKKGSRDWDMEWFCEIYIPRFLERSTKGCLYFYAPMLVKERFAWYNVLYSNSDEILKTDAGTFHVIKNNSSPAETFLRLNPINDSVTFWVEISSRRLTVKFHELDDEILEEISNVNEVKNLSNK